MLDVVGTATYENGSINMDVAGYINGIAVDPEQFWAYYSQSEVKGAVEHFVSTVDVEAVAFHISDENFNAAIMDFINTTDGDAKDEVQAIIDTYINENFVV